MIRSRPRLRAHAGVHGDDQPHALGIGCFKHARLQAVALAQPMRNMEAHRAAQHLDGGLEKDYGGGAIDVVVAIEEHRFMLRNGPLKARDGFVHAKHELRVVKMR